MEERKERNNIFIKKIKIYIIELWVMTKHHVTLEEAAGGQVSSPCYKEGSLVVKTVLIVVYQQAEVRVERQLIGWWC